jgi:NADH:ubiquinone oxidoreductase subunit C
VSTFSFQAASFYERQGYALFGVLEDFPPGHSQLSFRKRFKPCERAAVPGVI